MSIDTTQSPRDSSAPEEGWKQRDWSWVKDGLCVGWLDLFPKAEPLVFEHGGAKFLADDMYCANHACSCSDVILAFHRIETKGMERAEGILVGAVALDLPTGRSRVLDSKEGQSHNALRRLAQALLESRAEVRRELDRRYRFMREFAAWLARQRGAARPDSATSARVGRNDPCPCGSGRKFKRCCLNGAA